VGLAARVARFGLGAEARGALVTLPGVRGGPEVLERLDPVAPEAAARLRACLELVGGLGAADRVIVDLGLSRELGYYTGAVFEVYDPAVGFALGGGGRYDELMGRFGRSMPACGLALDLQRVHVAQAEEERLA
jgi:ATP phosphoribosyltransferase regulatory subunit